MHRGGTVSEYRLLNVHVNTTLVTSVSQSPEDFDHVDRAAKTTKAITRREVVAILRQYTKRSSNTPTAKAVQLGDDKGASNVDASVPGDVRCWLYTVGIIRRKVENTIHPAAWNMMRYRYEFNRTWPEVIQHFGPDAKAITKAGYALMVSIMYASDFDSNLNSGKWKDGPK